MNTEITKEELERIYIVEGKTRKETGDFIENTKNLDKRAGRKTLRENVLLRVS